MAAATPSPWMTTVEAARYLRRSRRFIIREIQSGRLRGARVGGRREVLTSAAWCDAWVQEQATPIMLRRRA